MRKKVTLLLLRKAWIFKLGKRVGCPFPAARFLEPLDCLDHPTSSCRRGFAQMAGATWETILRSFWLLAPGAHTEPRRLSVRSRWFGDGNDDPFAGVLIS